MKPKYLPTNEIEKQATELLEAKGNKSAPINLDVVAHRLGIIVNYTTLGEDISGLLVVKEDRGVIGINSDHAPVRQRFTLAHEIGHYVLHRQNLGLFIDKKYSAVFRDSQSSKGKERIEIQANQFAAALLMPATLLEKQVNMEGLDLGDDIVTEELAHEFGVSIQALGYRLANLGLFGSTNKKWMT